MSNIERLVDKILLLELELKRSIRKIPMNKKLLVLAFLFFFVFFSCSPEKKDWKKAESENTIEAWEAFLERHPEGTLADEAKLRKEKISLEIAQSINTIPAYKEFLEKYPQGPMADKAQLKIEKLYNQRRPAFRHTRTVKIVVDQSYGKAKNVNLHLEELAQRLCRYAGLDEVGDNVKDYDVTLKIQAKGVAKGATYVGDFMGYFYTGASISVVILLKVSGIPAIKKTFKGEKEIPKTITSSSQKNPRDAPFGSALTNSGFHTKILEMMEDAYGPNFIIAAFLEEGDWRVHDFLLDKLVKMGVPIVAPLIAVLKDKRWRVRYNAVRALGKIKDSRAVEHLIAFLKDEDERDIHNIHNLRRFAVGVLKKITGKDFGKEQARWKKWWKENKEKLQKKSR